MEQADTNDQLGFAIPHAHGREPSSIETSPQGPCLSPDLQMHAAPFVFGAE
jgi:hypothetical protein